MKRITVATLSAHVGESVRLVGWVYNLRKSGKISFPLLRDGTGVVQCVARLDDLGPETFDQVNNLTQESSVAISGMVRAEDRAQGGFEIDVKGLEVFHRVPEADPYPITPKFHSNEFLLGKRHLWLRSKRQCAIMCIRAAVKREIFEYLHSNGFTQVDSPVLVPASAKGSPAIRVQASQWEGFLTQGGQIYNEAAAMALGRVYSFGPVFYGGASHTRGRLAERWLVEPEMAFADLDVSMGFAQNLLGSILHRVSADCPYELAVLEREQTVLDSVASSETVSIDYISALDLVRSQQSATEYGEQFSGADRLLLTKGRTGLLVVKNFPQSMWAFNTAPADDKLSKSFSILVPADGYEVIRGGERINDLLLLKKRMKSEKVLGSYSWYPDLLKYGAVPRTGFSLSLERTVAWICGLDDLREAIPFPRTVGKMYPS